MFSSPILLQMPDNLQMTDEQFYQFCQVNRDYQIERNALGEISIMAPTGGVTGNRNFNLAVQLGVWSEADGTGICFDSSTGFILSSGAQRAPDASWINLERWNTLTPQQQEKFPPICPDFVIEIRSASDNLKPLKEKMEEYINEEGVQLGWLIDRKNRQVYIYRPAMTVECLDNPENVSGETVLPGFVLNMNKVW
jgi:Uma2 family endonuclease